jgi:AcrR family transcriptional regulator
VKASTRERERLARERDILNAAVKLFCEKGFDKTTMEDLARESEYTKKTIYRYFTCKEDIFFAVILDGYKILSEMIASSYGSKCNGLENIRRSYSAFYDFYAKHNQLLQLMTMEGIIKSYSVNKDVPYRENLDAHTTKMFKGIIELFILAKSEGSIRSDLDITHLAYSSIFLTTSFFHLFSLTGDSFTRFLKMDREAFADFCLERLIDSLCIKEK